MVLNALERMYHANLILSDVIGQLNIEETALS